MNATAAKAPQASSLLPIRRALFRGLAVVLPPLLTIVVFLWAWNMIDVYILAPCERFAGQLVVWSIRDVKSGVPDGAVVYREQPAGAVTSFEYKGTTYVPVGASNVLLFLVLGGRDDHGLVIRLIADELIGQQVNLVLGHVSPRKPKGPLTRRPCRGG